MSIIRNYDVDVDVDVDYKEKVESNNIQGGRGRDEETDDAECDDVDRSPDEHAHVDDSTCIGCMFLKEKEKITE